MLPDNGWIKIHRRLRSWRWYQSPETLLLWLELLLRANHEPHDWRQLTIQRGQCVAGRKSLSASTGLSHQQVRTSLDRLKSTKEITIESTKQYSIITISNYDDYQTQESIKQPRKQPKIQLTSNQRATNEQPTNNHKQEGKELKNEKNDKKENYPAPDGALVLHSKKPKFDPTGKTKYLDWVFLDDKQLARVREYYDARGLTADEFWEAVRELDNWFSQNPHMRSKRLDDAKALMGWPLRNAIARQKDLIYLERAKNLPQMQGRK